MAKKRAPGGGRKPKGDFSALVSALTIRMPSDMRKLLDLAAADSGKSVTQEILGRIRTSFQRDREKAPKTEVRALCFLIAKLASDVVGSRNSDGWQRYSWRSDRFFFCAFKTALVELLDQLEPQGELRLPTITPTALESSNEIMREELQSFGSPEERGKYIAKMRWKVLLNADPNIDLDFLDMLPEGSDLKAEIRRESYGMADARDDLQIKFQGEKS